MEAKAQRIGIYGGTFNPVHAGHLRVAREALRVLKLDKVLLVPNARSPLRLEEEMLPGPERLALVRLAVADDPSLEACDVEVARGGPSFTVETLRTLRERYPDAALFFLMGADSLLTLERWVAVEEMLTLAQAVVLPRPGFSRREALRDLEQRAPGLAENILCLETDLRMDISATAIREALAKGEPVAQWLPEPVAAALRAKRPADG